MLDEYYPTRAERAILANFGGEIAAYSEQTASSRLGAGSADKTRLLLQALSDCGSLQRFTCRSTAAKRRWSMRVSG